MNYTLQLHGERSLYQVPPGLYELMSDISRAVLRDQPARLYQYIADYLETVIQVQKLAQVAEDVVAVSVEEGLQMLAYIDSLGTTWEAANLAAQKIQNALRRYRCKKELNLKLEKDKEKKTARECYLHSQSFQDFLKTQRFNSDDCSTASSLLVNAYKELFAKKEEQEKDRSEVSIHTIERIFSRVSEDVRKGSIKTDCKRLVYQHSPNHSTDSSFTTLEEQFAEGEDQGKRPIAYEGTVDMTSVETVPSSDSMSRGLPGYHDENQSKVPMISETGELEEDQDIVTLYSIDSVGRKHYSVADGIRISSSFSNITLPSLNSENSKEMFDILERRYSVASKHLAPSKSLSVHEKPIEEQKQDKDCTSVTSITKGSNTSARSVREVVQTSGPRTSMKKGSVTSENLPGSGRFTVINQNRKGNQI